MNCCENCSGRPMFASAFSPPLSQANARLMAMAAAPVVPGAFGALAAMETLEQQRARNLFHIQRDAQGHPVVAEEQAAAPRLWAVSVGLAAGGLFVVWLALRR